MKLLPANIQQIGNPVFTARVTGRKKAGASGKKKLERKKKFKDEEEEQKEPIIDNDYDEPVVTKMEAEEIHEGEEDSYDKPMCKFCWSDETIVENPLLSTCKCKGGVQFIHYVCLKHWLNTKRVVKESQSKTVTTYIYKQFQCELCKTEYPYTFKTQNRKYCLVDYEKPENN